MKLRRQSGSMLKIYKQVGTDSLITPTVENPYASGVRWGFHLLQYNFHKNVNMAASLICPASVTVRTSCGADPDKKQQQVSFLPEGVVAALALSNYGRTTVFGTDTIIQYPSAIAGVALGTSFPLKTDIDVQDNSSPKVSAMDNYLFINNIPEEAVTVLNASYYRTLEYRYHTALIEEQFPFCYLLATGRQRPPRADGYKNDKWFFNVTFSTHHSDGLVNLALYGGDILEKAFFAGSLTEEESRWESAVKMLEIAVKEALLPAAGLLPQLNRR